MRKFNDQIFLKSVGCSIAPQTPMSRETYKKILFYTLMILGAILDGARNYLFGNTLISLIPNLSQPLHIILSILYIIFSVILFYGFDVAMLRNALGIADVKTDSYLVVSLNIEQLQKVAIINRWLMLSVDDTIFQKYKQVIKVLNDDMRAKYRAIQNYEESFVIKILKAAVLGFGIISNIAGSYFMINAILATWAATLVGTPLGWGIILLAISVNLGFYCAMGAASIMRLMSPHYANNMTLKKEINLFERDYISFFSRHIENREQTTQRGLQRTVKDAATQTDNFYSMAV